jgi:hypothetical protein
MMVYIKIKIYSTKTFKTEDYKETLTNSKPVIKTPLSLVSEKK